MYAEVTPPIDQPARSDIAAKEGQAVEPELAEVAAPFIIECIPYDCGGTTQRH